MASRDVHTEKFVCPECHAEGNVTLSENDYPFMKRLDLEVVKFDGSIKQANAQNDKLTVICSECGSAMK
ncbi:MAG: hypothetical protein H0S80_04025 [Desulfovibrionaceae bacterium]|nr:hypothetical protein [Desulfovibrionaceae bacterium]